MTRRHRSNLVPGSYRNQRIGTPQSPPGVIGQWQITDLHLPFTSIADPRDLANVGGLGGVFGVPDFLWVAGDGNAPTIGPALTQGGAPTVGASPWQLGDGSDVASERHTGASSRYYNAGPFGPAAGEDAIIVVIGKMGPFGGAASRFTTTMVNPADGYMLYRLGAAGNISLLARSPAVFGQASVFGAPGSIFLAIGIHNRVTDGLILWTPGQATVSAILPGPIVGTGVGIVCDPVGGGLANDGTEIMTVSYFFAPGIAPAWEAGGYARCVDFANRFTGIHPIQGDTPAFARNSAASWEDHNGIWHIASPDLPRAGDEDGLREEPTRTNKCYRNINPQATAGWAITGGTHTFPSDAAQLLTDGAQNWGPNIHQFVPGVGDQVIYGGALTANTNDHSTSVLMRGAAGGESVDIGVRDVSATTVTNLGTQVLTTNWVRYIIDGFTPGDVDEQFCLDCDLGDTVLFIASQLEEGAVSSLPIPNYSTVAAAARPFDDLTTDETPANIEGSVELTVEPLGWGGADAGIVPVLWLTAGGTAALYVNAGGTWEADIDGTTQLDSAVAPVDGVAQTIRLRWTAAAGVMSIDVDGTRVQGAYDGTLLAAGTWQTVSGSTIEIRDLKAYRNGGG